MKQVKHWWDRFIGDSDSLSLHQRLYNAVSLISIVILMVIVPANYFLGFVDVALAWSGIALVLAIGYYLVRYKNLYNISMAMYSASVYIVMFLNYKWNSGIDGPTLIMVTLSILMLMLMSPKKWHPLWLVIHVLLASVLLGLEYIDEEFAPDTYLSRAHRYLDIFITVAFLQVITFLAVRVLIASYDRERRKAEQLANDVEQKNAELTRLNHNKDRLISILSHDLRSPLATIHGFLDVLRTPNSGLSEAERSELESKLGVMVSGSIDLVDNLLAWSKRQGNLPQPALAEVNLKSISSEVMRTASLIAHSKDILLTDAVDAKGVALANADMLTIVLRNLVSNAIKFTPNGGSVFIESRCEHGKVSLVVRDTGLGIAADRVPDLFTLKPGYSYGTASEKGTQIGLSLCAELAQAMEGSISVESELGKGSSFTLTLQSVN